MAYYLLALAHAIAGLVLLGAYALQVTPDWLIGAVQLGGAPVVAALGWLRRWADR